MKQALLLSSLLTLPLHAASVFWDGGGSNQLWDTPENWSDNAAPSAANDYVVDNATVRSPDASSTSFAGNSLTIQNGAVLNLYRTNTGSYFNNNHAIPGLSVSNAEIRPESSNGSIAHTLTNALALSGANTVNMTQRSNYTMHLFLGGAITGSGSLNVTRSNTGSERKFVFSGDASGYSGDITVDGHTASSKTLIFDIANAGGWGTGNLTLGNFGVLNFTTAFDSGSSFLAMSDSSSLNLGAGASIAGLSIDGNAVPLGTYSADELTALGFGGNFSGDGSLSVIPEPSSSLLLVLSSSLLLIRKRRS